MNRFLAIILVFLAIATAAQAQSRRLYLKVAGEIFGVTGTSSNSTSFKVKNSFFKQGYVGASFIMEFPDSLSSTNATQTNLVIAVVDPQGNILREWFSFDAITTVDLGQARQRIFATGLGVDGVDDPVLGSVTFDDAVLTGTIDFTTNGLARSVAADLNCTGQADSSIIIFKGKATANNPFIAAPTNFNKSASSP